jgi:ssDNA-binding Zn-finger/Zn-ribbon topoisomerase 1
MNSFDLNSEKPSDVTRESCPVCGIELAHYFQPGGEEWLVCDKCRIKERLGTNGGSEVWRDFTAEQFDQLAATLAEYADCGHLLVDALWERGIRVDC